MERQRFASVVVVVGIGMFGAAIAARGQLNPWWSNAGVARGRTGGVGQRSAAAARLTGRVEMALAARGRIAWRCHGGCDAFLLLTGDATRARTRADGCFALREIGAQSPGRIISVVLIVVVVLAEEALWRGVAVELCIGLVGKAWAGVVAVLLYAVPQLIGGDLVLLAAALGAGTVFTIQRLVSDNLLTPTVTHGIWSACIFSLLPLA